MLNLYSNSLNIYAYLCIIVVFIIAFKLQRHFSYFSKQNVKYVRGWPIFGSMFDMLARRDTMSGMFEKFYYAYPNERFIGIFEMMAAPAYVIRDPELIKQISIKDFDHFVNHRASVDEKNDPLFSRALFQMQGDRWRDMRTTISPAFTASKMRPMLSLISNCAQNFSSFLLRASDGKPAVYDIGDLFSRYGSDSIATSVFGLEINSLQDRDNSFYKYGLRVSNFNGLQGLKFLGYSSFPWLMKFFKVSFISPESTKFFRDLVHGNMSFREKNNVVRRHDMINLLMEVKKGNLKHSTQENAADKNIGFATVNESETQKMKKDNDWNDDDFVAQCMIFFLGGFNAMKVGVSFLVYELACNPDIQKRLYEEITASLGEHKGELLSFEVLQTMKYLDMNLSEVLRRWSLGAATDRYANKPYVLENYDGTKVQLNVGDAIWFPTYAIHMDPQYFPNPTKFDPERFSDANKGSIPSGVYAPFGMGPRNCIASRYALMGIKAIVVYLLVNFTISKCSKTQDPLTMKKGLNVILEPEHGFWAEFQPRVK